MVDLVQFAAELTRDEGLRLKPYVDTTGNVTIGVGRNLTANGISMAEAKILLSGDMQQAISDCAQALEWWPTLDDVRQRVLANLCFNMGLPTLLTFTTFLTLVGQTKYNAAADDLLQTKWAGQVGQRAVRLAAVLRTGMA